MRYNMVGQVTVKDLQIGDLFCADQLPNVFLQLIRCDHKIGTAIVCQDEERALEKGESVSLLPNDLVRRAGAMLI